MVKYLWLVLIILLLAGFVLAGQPYPCDEQLRRTQALLDIARAGRDQAETSLAELFTRYQDALHQVDELKSKLGEEK